MIVCNCQGISDKDIKKATKKFYDFVEFTEETECGMCCGACFDHAWEIFQAGKKKKFSN